MGAMLHGLNWAKLFRVFEADLSGTHFTGLAQMLKKTFTSNLFFVLYVLFNPHM